MSWRIKNLMEARIEFIEDLRNGVLTMSEVCRRHGISRKTGYKWQQRHENGGSAALMDESRKPHRSPLKTCVGLEEAVLQIRKEHPVWGGRKIRRVLYNEGIPGDDLPAASTITNILRRHHMLGEGTRMGSASFQRFERETPNDLWQMDFKGHFQTSRSGRCYPLTVLDDASRYNLILEACAGETRRIVQPILQRSFERYGLPRQILCDHGNPWGQGMGPDGRQHGTPRLEVWLLRLGVDLIHGRVRHPQTQGKEERFHRTLKAEVLSQQTEWLDHKSCQKSFDNWRQIYNHKRPHEALGDDVPASKYQLSKRAYPQEVPTAESYQIKGDEVRITRSKGEITFHNRSYYIGAGFIGEPVFLREEVDGRYGVYYCWKRIGQIDLTKPHKEKWHYNSIRT